MFIQVLKERNPQLISAAVSLHQSGVLPANTWVIDLDTIAFNASILAREAGRHGLKTYLMTKQFARNPIVAKVAMRKGLGKAVAVDIQGAKMLHRYQVPVGHIGHLNQVPQHEIADALAMEPEVFTVFSTEMAEAVSMLCFKSGRTQPLLLRVVSPEDQFFDGQEGGILEKDLERAARTIEKLEGVEIAGTVSFPCIRYNPTPDIPVEATPNLYTIVQAAQRLKEMGFQVSQINAPGNTASYAFPIIAEAGATHAEPGHGLLGTTPSHAYLQGLPEVPAYLYLSEISHFVGDHAYCYGGGFWSDIYNPDIVPTALVGREPESVMEHEVSSIPVKQIIDYHGILSERKGMAIGDTVIFAFRTQMQMTRSQIAILSGIHSGEPRLAGLFDHAGTMIDSARAPLPVPETIKRIADVETLYSRCL